MTDLTNTPQRMTSDAKRHWSSKGEYSFYFVLIFFAALPICLIRWVFTAIKETKLPQKDPVQWAWSEAQTITPRIFWA
ncbi:MAG: cytochrome PufQ [Sulfitobacter sp.]